MRVKSASFVFALMCGFFFAGCLSNTAGSAVFSTTDQVSDGNYVISMNVVDNSLVIFTKLLMSELFTTLILPAQS